MTLKSAIQKLGDRAIERTFHFKECIPSEHDHESIRAKNYVVRSPVITSKTCLMANLVRKGK